MSPPATSGLRERKRAETRQRLERAALSLFLAHGFEETTIDDIAEAAGISRRSFFHHYASKDELLFRPAEQGDAALAAVLAAQSPDEPVLAQFEKAMLLLIERYATAESYDVAALIRRTPSLQARKQANYARSEAAALAALAAQGRDVENVELRIAVMAAVGILRIAAERWVAGDDPEALARYVRDGFAALRRVAAE